MPVDIRNLMTMLNLVTDKMGFLRFAAISGSAPARLGDLTWFYRTLPHLGVTKLLRVESGVPLIENVPAEPSEPALVALTPLPRYTGSLDDLRIVHGASESSTKLITYSGQYCRATLASRVRRRTRRLDEDCAPPGHSEIILVGGDRRPGHRYYHNPTEEQWERRDARQDRRGSDRDLGAPTPDRVVGGRSAATRDSAVAGTTGKTRALYAAP